MTGRFIHTIEPGVAFVESDSAPGTFYQLRGVGRAPVSCTCKGFRHYNHCKHAQAAVREFPVRLCPAATPAGLYGPLTAA
ncbi:MAG: hypothetical protein WD557_05745 [Dehalococcoidia bacterium]